MKKYVGVDVDVNAFLTSKLFFGYWWPYPPWKEPPLTVAFEAGLALGPTWTTRIGK
jgi:hypothetical protein